MTSNLSSRWESSFESSHSYVFPCTFSSNGDLGVLPLLTSSKRTMWGLVVLPKGQAQGLCREPTQVTESPGRQVDGNPNLASQIGEYLSLSDDWDGYGGVVPTLATAMDTFHFLRQYPSSLPQPRPMVAGSGVIGLYWEGNGCYASIDFDGSAHYCYIADRPDDEYGEDRVPVSGPLPQRLIEVIAETVNCR